MADTAQKLKRGTLVHMLFDAFPIGDACSWPGTKWEGDKLFPCGEPTVGNGLFCDPLHNNCEIHSVCERHRRNLESWND